VKQAKQLSIIPILSSKNAASTVTPQGSFMKQTMTPLEAKVITPSQRLKKAFNFQSGNANIDNKSSYKMVNNLTSVEDEYQSTK